MANSSSNELINTQHDAALHTNHDASVPSVALHVMEHETSFDTYSNLNKMIQVDNTQNLSAQNTTAGASVKVAAVNSQRNLTTKPALLTAHATNTGKNFQGLDEI